MVDRKNSGQDSAPGQAPGGKAGKAGSGGMKDAGGKNQPGKPELQDSEEFRDLEDPMNDFPGRPPKDSTWSP